MRKTRATFNFHTLFQICDVRLQSNVEQFIIIIDRKSMTLTRKKTVNTELIITQLEPWLVDNSAGVVESKEVEIRYRFSANNELFESDIDS